MYMSGYFRNCLCEFMSEMTGLFLDNLCKTRSAEEN